MNSKIPVLLSYAFRPFFLFNGIYAIIIVLAWLLTLHGVGPTTLFFSDRPDRITGHGTTEEMVTAWSRGDESFADDPPNATLSILGGDEIQDVVVVISEPVLLGSKLTSTVRILDGTLPAHGGASSLFIDTVGRPLTPVSVAGVARRSRRRAIRRN